MRRVKLRALFLSLFAFAAFAPSANAADGILPIYDASDGITVVKGSSGELRLRFAPKAAKLYEPLAGKRVQVGCGSVTDGPLTLTDAKLAKRRGTVRLFDSGDVCAVVTKQRKSGYCFPLDGHTKRCASVVVAGTDAGRKYLADKRVTAQLAGTYALVDIARDEPETLPGSTLSERMQILAFWKVEELASPDATPAPGSIGYWSDGTNTAVVVLHGDGTRKFVRVHDGVYSTNDLQLSFFGPGNLTLF